MTAITRTESCALGAVGLGLHEAGQTIERQLELVARGRARTGVAGRVGQLGPVVGVDHEGTHVVDRSHLPAPEMSHRRPPWLRGLPRDALPPDALDQGVLSDLTLAIGRAWGRERRGQT